ncbi:MAG: hypothetical protein A2144_03830 [Chloroflexi bacterium RBG_16_50_9]|nr:MAG: hypothetical protein A2144_03830 [Chloroflexi bacterium RBG_16_50_9]
MTPNSENDIKNSVKEFYAARSWQNFYTAGELTPTEKKAFECFKNGTVLDVCCGAGRGSFPLAQKGLKVTGIDFTPEMIRQANEKARKLGLETSFLVGDATNLPFENCTFDHVICLGSLQCLPTRQQRRQLLLEATRVLKTGGTFFTNTSSLTYPGKDGFRTLALIVLFLIRLPQRAWCKLKGQTQIGLSLGDVVSKSDKRSPFLHSFLKSELRELMDATEMKYEVFTADEFLGKSGVRARLSLEIAIVAYK